MSESVSALKNVSDTSGIAQISEIGPLGMVTLRGDLAVSAIRKAATGVAGADFPDRLTCTSAGERGLAWMSPDELLLIGPYAEVKSDLDRIRQALGNQHAMAVNVSDARASFRIAGPGAREVLAKLAPVDLDPAVFVPGMFRRTRLGQVPAAFWLREDQTFQLVCFRSVAQYVFDLLRVAAQPGSDVGHFR
jgi:sarcosine oxidase, subunit gamma